VFESGCYDALIIELGEGKGDNWWCMVYPPLCFIGGEDNGSGKITYKSKILEIIEEFKKKYFK
jgi:stage II sporulation protein R